VTTFFASPGAVTVAESAVLPAATTTLMPAATAESAVREMTELPLWSLGPPRVMPHERLMTEMLYSFLWSMTHSMPRSAVDSGKPFSLPQRTPTSQAPGAPPMLGVPPPVPTAMLAVQVPCWPESYAVVVWLA
jgi:hypothetical protein